MVARRWRRELDAALANAGLTDATWTPLVHLDETGGGISQKQLAALVGVDASTLVRLLDILERKDFIERRADSHDGRSRLVYLTPQGDAHVRQIRELLLQNEEAMLSDISDSEISNMLDVLERIDARLAERLSQRQDAGHEVAK